MGRSADPKLSIADLIEAINQLEGKRQVAEVVQKTAAPVNSVSYNGAWKETDTESSGQLKPLFLFFDNPSFSPLFPSLSTNTRFLCFAVLRRYFLWSSILILNKFFWKLTVLFHDSWTVMSFTVGKPNNWFNTQPSLFVQGFKSQVYTSHICQRSKPHSNT